MSSIPDQPSKPLGTEVQGKAAARADATTLTQDSADSGRKVAEKTPAQASARQPPEKAPQIDGYRGERKLGRGTFGEVWLYTEVGTEKQVAIKFFVHGTGQHWQSLQHEVKQLAMLNADPGIVQMFDVNADANPPYYIMAYADKGSLADRLKTDGPIPPSEATRLFHRVAQALAYVHVRGIRHCDLKPSNILLDALGHPLIADFGQAHLSSDASPALGTFFYMAPEQADLARVDLPDTRWDVYALGALFYGMLTGSPPHQNEKLQTELNDTQELAHRLERYRTFLQAAPSPNAHRRVHGVDKRLAEIIDRCLSVDPKKRLHDAGAVLTALKRREMQRRQRPMLLFGLATPILLLLALGIPALWAADQALEKSEAALIDQLLQSNLYSASMAANAVEDQLRDRRKLVEKYGATQGLPEAISKKDKNAVDQVLRIFPPQYEDFFSVAVVDDKGSLLGYRFFGEATRDHDPPANYRYRGWFHGGEDDHVDKTFPYPPIRHTHLSHPYHGKLTEKPQIAISTPIWNEARVQVVGVLWATVELKILHKWLTGVEVKNGLAALLDERGYCVVHSDPTFPGPELDKNPPRLDFGSVFDPERDPRVPYPDPMGENDGPLYLGRYVPVSKPIGLAPDKKITWGVLVQHRYDAAKQPVQELKEAMIRIGWILLGTVTVVASGLWAWLLWTIRREERFADA